MQVISQEHESTQTTILALLLSQKGGCTLPQLCKDYYDMEGEEIPWKKLGYVSLMDFIHSMSKSIKIEYSQNTLFLKGIATNKSKHVDKLVTGQKDQKAPIGRRTYKPSHYYPRTLSPKIHIPSEILSMIIDIVNEHPDGINKDFILQKVQISMPYTNITMSEMEEQLLVLSHKISVSNNKIFPVQSKSQNFSSKMPIMIASGEEDSDDLLDYVEDDLKFLPPANESTSKKLPAKSKTTSNFIKESVNATQYKSKSNTINDGYNDVTLRAETNESNSYNTYNYNDNVEIYTEDNNYDRVEKETYLENKHTEDLINSRIKFRLEKLIQNNPDGIWCAELPEKYLEEYKVSLSYTELGFSSVREFASYLPEIFHCVQIDEVGDFMLYYSKKQVPLINPKKKQKTINLAELHQIYLLDEENEALPTTLTPNTCNQLIPEGIVTIGESVGHIDVADLVRIENPYIEVVVVEVFTPSFFWIQLRKKQKAFKKFMNDLNHFYVAKHEDYIIPPVVLEKGLNCACIYNGIWHRGIIKAVKPDLQVTVMFYDYGTLKTYQPIEVYYLHRIFSVLPAQAIPCGLLNTRPYKGIKWTHSATHHFAIKTSDIPLVARIASTNEMDNSMIVTLTDTLGDEDIHINDWLVEQKLAEHGKMGDKVDMHNLLLYVEDNLLFSPEQCYEKETGSPDSVDIKVEETSSSTCLITPQRTLESKYFEVPLKQELSEETDKLTTLESNLQDQAQVKIPSFPQFIQTKRNLNPFLNDELICNQDEIKVAPGKLLQLWNENVKLQVQISAIFEILFSRVVTNSGTGDSSVKNKNILDLTETFSRLNVNSNSMSTNLENVNVTNPCTFATNDVQNVGNLSRDLVNDNSNLNSYTDILQHSLTKLNSFYSDIAMAEGSNLHTSQLFPNKSINKNAPPGFEKVALEINLKNQNKLMNGANIALPETLEKPTNFNIPLKETNPFKAAIINQMQTSQKECLNSVDLFISNSTQEPVVKHNFTTFEENGTAILNSNLGNSKRNSAEYSFDYQKYFPTCTVSTADNINTNLKYLPTNYTWPNDINNMGITTNDPSTIQRTESNNTYSSEYYDIYTPSYLRSCSQEHKPKQEEDILRRPISSVASCIDHTLNYGNSRMNTSWLTSNSFSPFVRDNKNVDEGYLTRPSTSHTMDRLSPLAQTIAHVNQYSESAKIWSTSLVDKSVQSDDGDKIYSQTMKNRDIKATWNRNQLQNSTDYSLPIDASLGCCKLYMKLIETRRCQIHTIHYQNDGWLIVHEFISFTEHKNISYLYDVVRILDIHVPFMEIDKTQCSIKFVDTNGSLTQQSKDVLNSRDNLHLIPLKSALKLLKILKIISARDLSDLLIHKKFETGIMHDIWVIMCEYGKFKYHIENTGRL
ncbi:uncharacterized protein LOC117221104 isoform X1 [Megalopta genalis]|uniref:uncharacterized protein LOC117221104 isoform X1 n=1 Tax=Megalopta genalis TaxID=115081 RepID=UPI003FD59C6A